MQNQFTPKLLFLKRRVSGLFAAIALILALLMQSSFANAQGTVNGKITDEKSEGVPGASVLLKGTGKGTSTASDGAFTLDGLDANSVLIISFVGYVSQEITVGNRTTLNITLVSDQKLLNELVVVGYGEQKKVNVIGSVSQIDSDAIENRPVTQVAHAITGQSQA